MADPLTRALRGLRRDGTRAKREPSLLVSIGLADKAEPESSGLVRRGDTRWLGESDNLGTQRAHESTMHGEEEASEEMAEGECPLCGGDHDASVHSDEDE